MSTGNQNVFVGSQDLGAHVPPINPELYYANGQKLARAQETLNAMAAANEAGLLRYEQQRAQLLAKAQAAAKKEQLAAQERREVEEALARLHEPQVAQHRQLLPMTSNAPSLPSGAFIEEASGSSRQIAPVSRPTQRQPSQGQSFYNNFSVRGTGYQPYSNVGHTSLNQSTHKFSIGQPDQRGVQSQSTFRSEPTPFMTPFIPTQAQTMAVSSSSLSGALGSSVNNTRSENLRVIDPSPQQAGLNAGASSPSPAITTLGSTSFGNSAAVSLSSTQHAPIPSTSLSGSEAKTPDISVEKGSVRKRPNLPSNSSSTMKQSPTNTLSSGGPTSAGVAPGLAQLRDEMASIIKAWDAYAGANSALALPQGAGFVVKRGPHDTIHFSGPNPPAGNMTYYKLQRKADSSSNWEAVPLNPPQPQQPEAQTTHYRPHVLNPIAGQAIPSTSSTIHHASPSPSATQPLTPKNQQTVDPNLNGHLPNTPLRWMHPSQTTSPRTPAQADKKFLARDLIRALGYSSEKGKRKRDEDDELPNNFTRDAGSRGTTAALASLAVDAKGDSQPVPSAAVNLSAPVDDTSFKAPTSSEPKIPVSVMSLERPDTYRSLASGVASAPLQSSNGCVPTRSGSSSEPGEVIEIFDDSSEDEPASEHKRTSSSRRPTPPPATPPPPTSTGQARVPLFLPSLSSSPTGTSAFGDTKADEDYMDKPADGTHLVDRALSGEQPVSESSSQGIRKTGKRMQVYVLVPPLPAYVKRAKVAGRSRGWVEEEDEETDEQNTAVMSEAERAAIQLSFSRLRERRCLWIDCEAVLNSGETLERHVAQHAHHPDSEKVFYCHWQPCLRKFTEKSTLLRHLEAHVRRQIFCGYAGCNKYFKRSGDLIRHHKLEHVNDTLRGSMAPVKPQMPLSLDLVPCSLPSYMMESRDVRQAPISQNRHASLGPWVLRNIYGPVFLGPRKHNAAVPLRIRRVSDGDESVAKEDGYDFLSSKSSTKIFHFDDLHSVDVSHLVHDGMTFWGTMDEDPPPEESVAIEAPNTLDASRESVLPQSEPRTEPFQPRVFQGTPSRSGDDDEEVVEMMLGV